MFLAAFTSAWQAYPQAVHPKTAWLSRDFGSTAATRAEAGCRDFVALRGVEDPDSFVLYERYASREAFEAHLASPHYEDIAVAPIRPLLSERTVEFRQVVEPDG
jgi:quinol monooxygenase YgiN